MNASGIQWLVRSQASLAREFQGDELGWLHPQELAQAERFASSERRASWLWGRVVAKRLLLNSLQHGSLLPWEINIQSLNPAQQGIAPIVWIGNESLDCHLSISHAGPWIAAAVASQSRIGIDLIDRNAHAPLRWWQSPGEELPAATAWSVREAAFKCLPSAEAFRPRAFQLSAIDDHGVAWRYSNGRQSAHGTAQVTSFDKHLLTLAQLDQRQTLAMSTSQAPVACHAEAL